MASVPLGFGQITLTTTAALISTVGGGIPSGANSVLMLSETNAARWRDDGVAPTASVGMPLLTGSSFLYSGTLSAMQICSETSTATLNLAFYKEV